MREYVLKGGPKPKRQKYVSVQPIPRAPRSQTYVSQRSSETKVRDTFSTIGVPINYDNPIIMDLCAIAGGSSINQRIGNKIAPNGFQIAISIIGPTTSPNFGVVRIALIQDMTIITEALTVDDIKNYYNNIQNDGATRGLLPWMPKNYQRQSTYRVLHDEVGTIMSVPSTNSTWVKHFYVKPKGGMKPVSYQGVSDEITDNAGGRVFLMIFGNNSVGVTTNCFVTAHVRMYYKDN